MIMMENVMEKRESGNRALTWIIAVVAVLFGILTIKSGGQVLFGDEMYRVAAGDYVPFVLWFNFVAGFVYLIAGVGIALRKRWSVWLSLLIAVSTLMVFAAFGLHVFGGGAYETRTIAAMTLRSTVWTIISIMVYRKLMHDGWGK
jgi:K+-transporting ATPase A subunit